MNNVTQTIKTLALATILSFGISFAYAWTAPTTPPTGGNTAAPLNTSDTDQIKTGGITFGGNIGANAMAISNAAANALQVAGGATFGGLITSNNKILINDKTAEPGMEIFNMNTDNQDVGQRFHIGNLAWYSMGLDRSDGGKFKINYGPNVGDANHLTIDTAGNVEIGQKLNVDGDMIVGYNGNASIFTRHINGKQVGSNTADTLYVNYGQSGYGMNVGNATTNNNPLNVYGPGYFSGNVGIGTTSPASPLSVNGNAYIVNGSLGFNRNPNDGSLPPGGNVAGGRYQISYLTDRLQFETYNSAGTNTGVTVMSANNGNVGIGTTNPGVWKLNVVGGANIDGALNANGQVKVNARFSKNDSYGTELFSVGQTGRVTAGLYGGTFIVTGAEANGAVGIYPQGYNNLGATQKARAFSSVLNIQSSLLIQPYGGSIITCNAQRKGTLHNYNDVLYYCAATGGSYKNVIVADWNTREY